MVGRTDHAILAVEIKVVIVRVGQDPEIALVSDTLAALAAA